MALTKGWAIHRNKAPHPIHCGRREQLPERYVIDENKRPIRQRLCDSFKRRFASGCAILQPKRRFASGGAILQPKRPIRQWLCDSLKRRFASGCAIRRPKRRFASGGAILQPKRRFASGCVILRPKRPIRQWLCDSSSADSPVAV